MIRGPRPEVVLSGLWSSGLGSLDSVLDILARITTFRPSIEDFMAKKNTVLVKLASTGGTGFYFVKKRNPKQQTEKLSFKKYDPKLRKHVEFKEEKLKS